MHGWAQNREANRRKSVELTRQALGCAPDDPDVLAISAAVLGYFWEDLEVAISLVDRSLALNPSFARGWYWSGVLRNWAGRPDLALEHFANFLRLSPRERFGFHQGAIGIALFFSRRFDEAAKQLLASLDQLPTLTPAYRFLASCYAHMGRLDEARQVVERLRVITPLVVPSATPYRNPEHRELFLSGLRLAADEAE
jgi:adenylate cyclase